MISRNIDHEAWMSANRKERLRLYAEALSAGLEDVAQTALPAADVSVLRLAIERAASQAEEDVE